MRRIVGVMEGRGRTVWCDRRIATGEGTGQGKACLEISRHTSHIVPEPLKERLSLLRAELIKRRLVALEPKPGSRMITYGMGSRALIPDKSRHGRAGCFRDET